MENLPRCLHIVADENIPIVQEQVPEGLRLKFMAASEITSTALASADAVLVRSVTRVDGRLLEGTPVSFVGTATTGVDHIDLAYLSSRGIGFADAAGSNADSVVDYTLAAIAVAFRRDRKTLQHLTVGIIGVGRIGGRLAERLEIAGARVLRCDPPRQAQEGGEYYSMEDVLSGSDVVTLHVPLIEAGVHRTRHLIGRDSLRMMRPGAWLINTSRGPVVDNVALRAALEEDGSRIRVVLDVWEGEPAIDRVLMPMVDIATPHIAGYAHDGKIRGGQMMLDAIAAHFGETSPQPGSSDDAPAIMPPDPWLPETDAYIALASRMYDIEADDRAMRAAMERAVDEASTGAAFAELRKTYPVRREFGKHVLGVSAATGHQRVIAALGIGQAQIR